MEVVRRRAMARGEISSEDALSTGSWHHVSMVSNDIYGLTLRQRCFCSKFSRGVWEKTLMDLPTGMTDVKNFIQIAYASSSYVYTTLPFPESFATYTSLPFTVVVEVSFARTELRFAAIAKRTLIVLNYVDDTQATRQGSHHLVLLVYFITAWLLICFHLFLRRASRFRFATPRYLRRRSKSCEERSSMEAQLVNTSLSLLSIPT